MTSWLALAAVLALTAATALVLRARDGRVRAGAGVLSRAQLAAVGAPAGAELLLELTAPGCAPCVAARRVLDEVAAGRTDVAVRAVDVGDAVDVARAAGVLRAPTTLVVAPDGRVRARIGGVPSAADVRALLPAGQ